MIDKNNQVSNYNGFAVNSMGKNTNTVDKSANQTIAFEKLTVSSTAVSLANVQKSNAVKAIITIENGDIRVKTDGNNPTATDGLLIKEGYILEIIGPYEISNFKAIRANSVDVILQIEYKN